MKKFVFSVASRATSQLQIKPSGSGEENAPSLLLLFREDTILIILSGVVGEAKKLSLKEPLKYDLWSTVKWGILVAREGPMLVKNSLNLLAIN